MVTTLGCPVDKLVIERILARVAKVLLALSHVHFSVWLSPGPWLSEAESCTAARASALGEHGTCNLQVTRARERRRLCDQTRWQGRGRHQANAHLCDDIEEAARALAGRLDGKDPDVV